MTSDFANNAEPRAALDHLVGAAVIDAAGHPASVVAIRQVDGEVQAAIRLQDGTEMQVPATLFAARPDGGYRLPFSVAAAHDAAGQPQLRFPVTQETLQVDTRVVDTGRGVRLHKTVREHEQLVDLPLRRDELEIDHVAVGQVVDESAPPRTRYEGDTLVVPVLEEVLVVQKQLLLKEELRITRRRTQVHAPQRVSLKSEQVSSERFDEGSESSH